MKRKAKKLAILLAVVLGLFLLFSQLFISTEEGHECIGENCAICQVIQTCEETQKAIATNAHSLFMSLVCFGAILVLLLQCGTYEFATLVKLKTKISD